VIRDPAASPVGRWHSKAFTREDGRKRSSAS